MPQSKRFVVAGSGPSLLSFDPNRIDLADTIVRVNNFFFEKAYYLGRRVDLVQIGGDRWIFPFYAATLNKLMAEGAYQVAAWSCHQPDIIARGQKRVCLPFVPVAFRDEAVKRVVAGLINNYGKRPTTGVLAVVNAHGLGAQIITLVGIDLYSAPERYAYELEGHAAALIRKIDSAGYNLKFHDPALDRAILEYLANRNDVEINKATTDVSVLDFLPPAPVVSAGFEQPSKTDVLSDWVRWAGPWPIGAMRLARRTHELHRSLRKKLFQRI